MVRAVNCEHQNHICKLAKSGHKEGAFRLTRRMLLEGVGCVCDGEASNLISMGWLLERPSVLMWAEEILMSELDYRCLASGLFERTDSYFSETLGILFDELKTEGIVRLFDPKPYLTSVSRESVAECVEKDLLYFGAEAGASDEKGKREPAMVHSDYGSYCAVMLESLYTNMLLSRLLESSCLMDDAKAKYIIDRFGRGASAEVGHGKSFDELYSVIVPELRLLDYRLLCPESRRNNCVHGEECTGSIRKNSRRFVDALLMLRGKEEIRGLSCLIEHLENETGGNPEEVTRAALHDIAKAQKRVRTSFEAAKRWSTIVTEISGSVAVSSLVSGNPVASTVAGVVSAVGALGIFVSDGLQQSESWKITYANEYTAKMAAQNAR